MAAASVGYAWRTVTETAAFAPR
eukprot:COSAG02_NODE_27488_length_608_cov_1.176817_1_plen_22_part_01